MPLVISRPTFGNISSASALSNNVVNDFKNARTLQASPSAVNDIATTSGFNDDYLSSALKIAEMNSNFNALEAQKNREWQEYMSSSAHRREIADLQAAGLNPVLSVLGSNGASTPSGSTASADTSVNNVLGSIFSGNSAVSAAAIGANASMYNASLSSSASRLNTQLTTDTQKVIAGINKEIARNNNITSVVNNVVSALTFGLGMYYNGASKANEYYKKTGIYR